MPPSNCLLSTYSKEKAKLSTTVKICQNVQNSEIYISKKVNKKLCRKQYFENNDYPLLTKPALQYLKIWFYFFEVGSVVYMSELICTHIRSFYLLIRKIFTAYKSMECSWRIKTYSIVRFVFFEKHQHFRNYIMDQILKKKTFSV